jgi:hypothetical protein
MEGGEVFRRGCWGEGRGWNCGAGVGKEREMVGSRSGLPKGKMVWGGKGGHGRRMDARGVFSIQDCGIGDDSRCAAESVGRVDYARLDDVLV